jgi:hypothetical protein
LLEGLEKAALLFRAYPYAGVGHFNLDSADSALFREQVRVKADRPFVRRKLHRIPQQVRNDLRQALVVADKHQGDFLINE